LTAASHRSRCTHLPSTSCSSSGRFLASTVLPTPSQTVIGPIYDPSGPVITHGAQHAVEEHGVLPAASSFRVRHQCGPVVSGKTRVRHARLTAVELRAGGVPMSAFHRGRMNVAEEGKVVIIFFFHVICTTGTAILTVYGGILLLRLPIIFRYHRCRCFNPWVGHPCTKLCRNRTYRDSRGNLNGTNQGMIAKSVIFCCKQDFRKEVTWDFRMKSLVQ